MGQSITALTAGRRFEDVCEIETGRKPLGKGSFATVWRGKYKEDGSHVAVKVMEKTHLEKLRVNESHVRQEVEFLRECGGQEGLFVRLRDYVESGNRYYIILEYCAGGNLEDAAMNGQAKLQEHHVRPLMWQMLHALAFLHERLIIHRDVKPHNFLVEGNLMSDRGRVKLSDFGIATRFEPGRLLKEKFGTPTFMAPEMHLLPRRSRGYDCKVDIWAVGVVMVFLLAAEYPFVDGDGHLLREQLIKGNMPIWDMSGFGGLYQAFREAAGMRRKNPTCVAQDLIRKLVMVKASQRLHAAFALQHDWLVLPMDQIQRQEANGSDGKPLLKWSDFQADLKVGFSAVVPFQEEASIVADWAGGIAEDAINTAADKINAVANTNPVDYTVNSVDYSKNIANGSLKFCMGCRRSCGHLGYTCPQCHCTVCIECLRRLPTAVCPSCKHDTSDMAVTQAVAQASSKVIRLTDFAVSALSGPAMIVSDMIQGTLESASVHPNLRVGQSRPPPPGFKNRMAGPSFNLNRPGSAQVH